MHAPACTVEHVLEIKQDAASRLPHQLQHLVGYVFGSDLHLSGYVVGNQIVQIPGSVPAVSHDQVVPYARVYEYASHTVDFD